MNVGKARLPILRFTSHVLRFTSHALPLTSHPLHLTLRLELPLIGHNIKSFTLKCRYRNIYRNFSIS